MREKQNSSREQGMEKYFFRASAEDFKKIPGSPIAYWVSDNLRKAFIKFLSFSEYSDTRIGLITGDNDYYIRQWQEVSLESIGFAYSRTEAEHTGKTWFPQSKGGEFRRWYGNHHTLVNWENDGYELQTRMHNSGVRILAHNFNLDKIFLPGITWTKISSGTFGARFQPKGFLFNDASANAFPRNEEHQYQLLAFLCSKLPVEFLKAMNPTLNFLPGNVASLPISSSIIKDGNLRNKTLALVERTKQDWDSYETSWDFTSLPLLNPNFRQPNLKLSYQKLRSHWREMTLEMQRLEEENNRILIEAYGLQDELTPDVPLGEITLTCNPHYRYGGDRSEDELEALLLADTMRELVSYAVGCMFGRYSLDKPGLILANQGETLADFVRKVCSEKWVVKIRDYPLSTGANGENDYGDSEKLPGVDSLAEGNGLGGTGLSGDQTVPEGGALRVNQSSQAVSGFHSVQHSGRSGQKIDGGVSEFFINCERFKSRDGDPNPACPALEVCNERYSAANSQSVRRSEPTFERSDEQSQITTHCPLSTIHFLPDDDNVIPMLDGDWFTDDIAERFRKFLRVAFGEEHYEENLRFIEQALNIRGRRNYGIRDYFLSEFYNDHVKRYKKRPIYWLFSSPRGSFNALIYMHRYRPDTVSVVLNDYLREFRTKLASHKNHLEAVSISGSSSQGEKTKALKESEKISKMIAEMEEYEREVLYPLATEQVEIDLDDGVRANYPKFGTALKKIQGLDAKED